MVKGIKHLQIMLIIIVLLCLVGGSIPQVWIMSGAQNEVYCP